VRRVPPADVGPLPDGTHLLHIGPQKTGSTALQRSLHEQRERLREHGVVYPGPGVRSRLALGAGLGYPTPVGGKRPHQDLWRQMLADVNDPSARVVCISSEAFGRAPDRQIARTVEALGGDRPHVLLVARRYDRLLPSQWQQRVKARVSLHYEEWLRIVLDPAMHEDPSWRNLWVPHDSVRLAERWAAVVGAGNVSVLVTDDSDHTLLSSVVERLLGVPPSLLTPGDDVVNRSLGYGEVEVLRAVNAHFEERGYAAKRYHRLVHRGLLPALLEQPRHPDDSPIPPLPAWSWAPLVGRSRERVAGLERLDVRIIGDPEILLLPDQPPPGVVDDGRSSPTTAPTAASTSAPARVPLDIVERALGGLIDGAYHDRRIAKERSRQDVADEPAATEQPGRSSGRAKRRRRRPGSGP
jgi:hypothetical protein